MADLKFVDAAFPSGIPSNMQFDGVCFYIGGDTPHVWTTGELGARKERYRLPIHTRSNPSQVDPTGDAQATLAELAPYRVPKNTLVALDSETSIDPAWVKTYVNVVNRGGFKVIDYGSESFVHGNDNPDGYYWGADWTDVPHLDPGDQATQYVSFSGYDESLMESTLPFWDTKPGPIGKPGPMAKGKVMLIVHIQGNPAAYLWNGTNMSHITSVDNEAQFKAAGIQSVQVTADQFAEMAGSPSLA